MKKILFIAFAAIMMSCTSNRTSSSISNVDSMDVDTVVVDTVAVDTVL